MPQNMYRVGDYVYFEFSSAGPYQIRRIEELNKTTTGNVEAKVMCFYRRRDVSPALLDIADQLPPDSDEQKGVKSRQAMKSDQEKDEQTEKTVEKVEIESTETESSEVLGKGDVVSKDEEGEGVTLGKTKEYEAESKDVDSTEDLKEAVKEDSNEVMEEKEEKKEDKITVDEESAAVVRELSESPQPMQVDEGDVSIHDEVTNVEEVLKKEEMDDREVSTTTTTTCAQKADADTVAEQMEVTEVEIESKKSIDDEIKSKKSIDEEKTDDNRLETGKSPEIAIGEEKLAPDSNEQNGQKSSSSMPKLAGLPTGSDKIAPVDIHLLRQRELFLSRQIETLPATNIRGKCVVTLLNEVETPDCYLNRDDAFFYSLVYDPSAKTLLADKGEIRIGDKYQAKIPNLLKEEEEEEEEEEHSDTQRDAQEKASEKSRDLTAETLVFHPYHQLNDRDIDQFLIVARAVGTFSRALDSSSAVKLPTLHMTAAAASRDVTLFHAMALVHQADYDLGKAMKFLVPPPSKDHYPLEADKSTAHNTVSLGGPILCRDQMEEWSAAEANLFEEAIEKYGKDFNDIRQDFLPWKALKDIVEYYYMWKTTDRYVQSKRVKANDAESRLKQVYIPNYNKPNPNLVGPPNPTGQPVRSPTTSCESCKADMCAQWYAWGPVHLQLRLCMDCWNKWKKYGGLARQHEYENYDKDGSMGQQQQLQQKTGTIEGGNFLQNATGISRGTTISSPHHSQRSHCAPQQIHRLGGQTRDKGGLHGPKTRVAFLLHTTLMTRVARRLAPKTIYNGRKSARRPFQQISSQQIKQHYQTRDARDILSIVSQIRGGARLTTSVVATLGHNQNNIDNQNININNINNTNNDQHSNIAAKQSAQAVLSTAANDTSLNQQQIADYQQQHLMAQQSVDMPSGTQKRLLASEDISSKERSEPPSKMQKTEDEAAQITEQVRCQMYQRWINTQEDTIYVANNHVKTLRRTVSGKEMRHIARKPEAKNAAITELLPAVTANVTSSINTALE